MSGVEKQKGFTIVELLIVVVVIAILAAITIVAYTGIKDRANYSAIQSGLAQLVKKLEVSKVSTGGQVYPATLFDAGVSTTPANTTYTVNANFTGYCIVMAQGGASYYVTQDTSKPVLGTCASFDGLVGWWPLNGDTHDASGNVTATTSANATLASGQNGQSNSAYQFNGTSSTLTCGTGALLRPTVSVSVSAWVYLDAYSPSMSGIVNNGGGGYWLYLAANGLPNFYVTASAATAVTGTSVLALGQWYHLVGTYTSGQRYLYVNGAQVATDTLTGGISNYGPEICQIGGIKYLAGRFLNGRIDDVRIYNKALSASEVTGLYTAGAQ